jgi:hypothetical protein
LGNEYEIPDSETGRHDDGELGKINAVSAVETGYRRRCSII